MINKVDEIIDSLETSDLLEIGVPFQGQIGRMEGTEERSVLSPGKVEDPISLRFSSESQEVLEEDWEIQRGKEEVSTVCNIAGVNRSLTLLGAWKTKSPMKEETRARKK